MTVGAISKWIRLGRPLDDPEEMERLAAKKYTRTARDYAKTYGVPIGHARRWMTFAWPLDNVEAVKRYLAKRDAARGSNPARSLAHIAKRRAKIIPMHSAASTAEADRAHESA